jgi:hypothetical protein
MKKISAEIIADSKNEQGDRITTFVLTFPRFILAELNTHRMFSRNSASRRAIPFKKMVEMVKEDPFIPIAFQEDHSGMQGTEYLESRGKYMLTEPDDGTGMTMAYSTSPVEEWLNGRDAAVKASQHLSGIGVTKQLCNRLLEPFMWHTAIVTATEFENFFKLRCPQYPKSHIGDCGEEITEYKRSKKDWIKSCGYPKNTFLLVGEDKVMVEDMTDLNWLQINEGQSEIHIMELAEQMWDAMNESTPKQLKEGGWHIPFGDRIDKGRVVTAIDLNKNYPPEQEPEGYRTFERFNEIYQESCVRIATARCARVSYLNFEGKDDYESDIKLHDRLAKEGHWSPFEHCARTMNENIHSGNFKGFKQYRKQFNNESGTK